MEKSNKIERSEVWNNIYEVLARLDLKEVEGDFLDRPSAATEIEQAVKKLLPIHNVSGRFCSDTNEGNKKILTGILYKHTDEKSMVIREIDYDEVINDIMEYF